MTAADRAVAVLVVLAAGCLAWRGIRLGGSLAACLPWALAGAVLVTKLVQAWKREVRQPARRLVACADGSLWLHTTGDTPCRVAIGSGTRLVGPSVFLDLRAVCNPAARRMRTWLTPLDVPPEAIRRWSVLLPRSGGVAGS